MSSKGAKQDKPESKSEEEGNTDGGRSGGSKTTSDQVIEIISKDLDISSSSSDSNSGSASTMGRSSTKRKQKPPSPASKQVPAYDLRKRSAPAPPPEAGSSTFKKPPPPKRRRYSPRVVGPTTARRRSARFGVNRSRQQKKKAPLTQNATAVKRKRVYPINFVRRDEGQTEANSTVIRSTNTVSDWDAFLTNPLNVAWVCPVNYFPHAPFASTWDSFAKIGLTIEVPHPQSTGELPVYSVATVIKFAGYKALVRFEKVESGGSYISSWLSFCSSIPKPFGYSLSKQIVVYPVTGNENKVEERDKMIALSTQFMEKIFGKPNDDKNQTRPTIAWNHKDLVVNELQRQQAPFVLNQIVEIIDKDNVLQNRLGNVVSITGNRIVVRYLNEAGKPSIKDTDFFVVSMMSDLVHQLGWSHTVGQTLKGYPRTISKPQFPQLKKRHFPQYPKTLKIEAGMVFEVRHPLKPFKIVAGYVSSRLRHGYFEACIETNCADDHAEFVFHVTSDYILPCGFCRKHNLELEVPKGEDPEEFDWLQYCEKKNVTQLDLNELSTKPAHKFTRGGKLEAGGSISNPTYFGPATIYNVADHLLLLHFDGWNKPNRENWTWMWVSAYSHDIYPIGWAEIVGHVFDSHPAEVRSEELYFIKQREMEPEKSVETPRSKNSNSYNYDPTLTIEPSSPPTSSTLVPPEQTTTDTPSSPSPSTSKGYSLRTKTTKANYRV